MTRKGIVHRIKRNLYTCVNLITLDDIADKYLIGSSLTNSSCIISHSAFEFYGLYNQVFNEVQVASKQKFNDFMYNNLLYRHILSESSKQIDTIKGVRVASVERTIVDSIDLLGKTMDCEELIKCIKMIPLIKEGKICEMLSEYDKDILYRKTGYLLSFFKNDLNISDGFFDFCHAHSKAQNKGSLSYQEIRSLKYISEWGLYAYEDINELVDKGDGSDV